MDVLLGMYDDDASFEDGHLCVLVRNPQRLGSSQNRTVKPFSTVRAVRIRLELS